MGKKRRYRKYPQKFGRKYALKYGLNNDAKENPSFEGTREPEPAIIATPELVVEVKSNPTTEKEVWWPLGEDIEAAAPPKKKRAPRKKSDTPRKTRRKKTTTAKTAS